MLQDPLESEFGKGCFSAGEIQIYLLSHSVILFVTILTKYFFAQNSFFGIVISSLKYWCIWVSFIEQLIW